jgi:hypothetical protein
VLVACHKRELVLPGKGGNPNIIFRNRMPLRASVVFDSPIILGRRRITHQDRVSSSKHVDPIDIRFYAGRFLRTVIEFAQHDAGDKRFV